MSTPMVIVRQRPRRTRGERGAVMVIGALMFAFLAMPLCAVGVDMARWWVEAQRLQAAADAASTAGVTFMPDDFDKAKARAIEIAASNGYAAGAGTTITVSPGAKPTQLKVVISQQVDNTFAQSFGIDTSKITRGAVADYNGPAPMGSPCNTFGNEPLGTTTRGPQSSQLSIPALADCSVNPQFWANIGGPDWPKGNGDQFMTRSCSGTDGCAAGKNTEFDPRGYYYVIRVAPGAVGKPVTVQLYDPSFVAQGDYCEGGPSGNAVNNNNWNDWAKTDAIDRYKKQASGAMNSFCTGDVATSAVPTVTSFGLRGTTDTNDPRNAAPVSGCVRQYPGYAAADLNRDRLKKGSTGTNAYNDNLAKVFHQWVTMCTFTPTTEGDHFLQVRTNVKLNTTSPDGEGGYQGNMNVYTQAGDDLTVGGGGANRFAIRAYASGVAAGDLSVSAFERMPIYANATGANTEFNLVRVIPAAASKTLVFGFFDVGEAASGGTMQVLPPADSNMSSNIANCKGTGKVNGTLTDCKITGISSANGWNGRSQFIRVPIPNNYTCNTTTPGGCWFRIGVNFGGSNAVNDSTTWTAKIEGEPIRLIE